MGQLGAGGRQRYKHAVTGSGPPRRLEDTLVRPESYPPETEAPDDSAQRSPSDLPAPKPVEVTREHAHRYEDGGEVGRGGLGKVVVSYDRHLAREVAKKELLGGDDAGGREGGSNSQAVARFLREARVTAQLEHPNIVPVYELGERSTGSLYYTMKLVRGRTLRKALEDRLDLQDRLSLLPHFVDLCQAIAYAHSRGVIHRDIKPENVMIGEFGETLVLDWGVAKLRGAEDLRQQDLARFLALIKDENHAKTLPGSTFGTPAFMSPEQASGKIDIIDERSDIWSLGVVLYQLLSGRLPYPQTGLVQLLWKVSHADIIAIDDACSEAPPELRAVVRRALAEEPIDRYQSAKDLADEIESYRSGQRVEAHAYSTRELATRFFAQHRNATYAALAATGLLVFVLFVAYAQLIDERDRALRAEAAGRRSVSEALVARAGLIAAESEDWMGAEVLAVGALAEAENPAARGLLASLQGRLRPQLRWQEQTYAGCSELALSAEVVACATSFGVQLFDSVDGGRRDRFASQGFASAVALQKGGDRLAFASEEGTVEIRRLADGALEGQWPTQTPPVGLGFIENALIVGSGPPAALLRAAQPYGRLVPAPGTMDGPRAAGGPMDVNGSVAAFFDEGRGLIVYDGTSSRVVARIATKPVGVAVAPLGRTVAVATEDNVIHWFSPDLESPSSGRLDSVDVGEVRSLAFGPDSRWLFVGNERGRIHRLDIVQARHDAAWLAHEGPILALAAGVEAVTSAGADRKLRYYRITSPADEDRFERGGSVPIDRAAIGSERAVLLGRDGNAHLTAGAALTPVQESVLAVAASPDGTEFALASPHELVRIQASATYRSVLPLMQPRVLAFSPNRSSVVIGAADGNVWLAEKSGAPALLLSMGSAISGLGFSPDGRQLFAVAEAGRLIKVTMSRPTRVLLRVSTPRAGPLAVGLRWVASIHGAQVVLRDATTGGRMFDLPHPGSVTAVVIDPSGNYLATGDESGTLRIYTNTSPPRLAAETKAHRGPVRDLRVSGSMLLSVGSDGRLVRLDLSGLTRPAADLTALVHRRYGLRRQGFNVVPR